MARYPITPAEEIAVGPNEVPALLVRPRADGPHPGAIIQHGYGADKGDLLPLGEYLAERGFVVLLPDAWGHGERLPLNGPSFMNTLSVDFIAETVQRTAEDVRACLDMLAQRPEVQPEAISVGGFSMGAGVALAVGMQDTRVAAVASIAGASMRDLLHLSLPGIQPPSEELQRVAAEHDPSRELANFAPRPLLLMHGRQDDMVDPQAAQHLYDAALPYYQDYPERLALKWYNVSHMITVPMIVDAVDWLAPFFER
ncbi:MAG TPA: alpha/beta fold hydrolase [Ktedonobacterales bacterium]